MRVGLPGWVEETIPPGAVFPTPEEQMALAVRLAEENARRGTGGPFGAAVLEEGTGKLIAPGVNRVVPARCSCAHAEVVALSLAQQALATHDLGGRGLALATSTEPCAMCLGAAVWSGVGALLIGARDEDARAVGFDEGPKPAEWERELERRGIKIVRDVMRKEAAAVLRRYASSGGAIYNPTR